jgi:hypothetical protein
MVHYTTGMRETLTVTRPSQFHRSCFVLEVLACDAPFLTS